MSEDAHDPADAFKTAAPEPMADIDEKLAAMISGIRTTLDGPGEDFLMSRVELTGMLSMLRQIAASTASAVERERVACARVCEAEAERLDAIWQEFLKRHDIAELYGTNYAALYQRMADMIRARTTGAKP